MTIEISLENGKYTYRRDEETGKQTALRYGEDWRDLVGDKFVAAMADCILDLQHQLNENTLGEPKVFCNQEDLRKIMREAAEEARACGFGEMVPPEEERVASVQEEVRVGRLPTMNQDEYPGLGAWWVQLRTGTTGEVLARVYGDTPQEAHSRAVALARSYNSKNQG